jgi:hypothetical protein
VGYRAVGVPEPRVPFFVTPLVVTAGDYSDAGAWRIAYGMVSIPKTRLPGPSRIRRHGSVVQGLPSVAGTTQKVSAPDGIRTETCCFKVQFHARRSSAVEGHFMCCSSSQVSLRDGERCFEHSHAFSGDCVASLWYFSRRRPKSAICPVRLIRPRQDRQAGGPGAFPVAPGFLLGLGQEWGRRLAQAGRLRPECQ